MATKSDPTQPTPDPTGDNSNEIWDGETLSYGEMPVSDQARYEPANPDRDPRAPGSAGWEPSREPGGRQSTRDDNLGDGWRGRFDGPDD